MLDKALTNAKSQRLAEWHSESFLKDSDPHLGHFLPPLLPEHLKQKSVEQPAQRKIHIQEDEKPCGSWPHFGQV